jgi:hypothetical protein
VTPVTGCTLHPAASASPCPAPMDPANLLPPGDWPYVLTQIPVTELQALPLNYGQAPVIIYQGP